MRQLNSAYPTESTPSRWLLPLMAVVLSLSNWLPVSCVSNMAVAGQTVVVVLDDSGSMDRNMQPGLRKMAAAKQALSSVLGGLSRDTKVGILALNSQVGGSHWVVPVGSADSQRWVAALNHVRAKGGTPLGEAMREAADALLKLRADEPYETYRLLIVTDGEATDAPLMNSLLPDLRSRGINLDVIGVSMEQAHTLAQSAHTYREAGDAARLTEALTAVFAETTGDDQSTQSDFELLAGLPDDVAGEIVKSLSAPRNDPLQTLAAMEAESIPVGRAPGFPVGNAPVPTGGAPTVGSSVAILFSSLCCFGGIGLVLLVIVSIVLNAVKNNTRS